MLQKKDKKKKKEEQTEEPEQSVVDLLGAISKGPEQRSIMFVGEVDEEKSADLISALLVLIFLSGPLLVTLRGTTANLHVQISGGVS